ncbi:MAG: hypothetical protein WCY56_06165 [Aminobacteriaceae bacterium]
MAIAPFVRGLDRFRGVGKMIRGEEPLLRENILDAGSGPDSAGDRGSI